MYVAGLTDVGVARSQNQDSIFVSTEPIGPLPNLFIVADGMGGHRAGDIASKMAIELVSGYIRDFRAADIIQQENYLDLMVAASQHANDAIFTKGESEAEMRGMGTTLTACVLDNGRIYIAHIGDSRAYAISPTSITRLTTDHTYAEELMRTGRLTEEEAKIHPRRHVLTRALGAPGNCEVDGLTPDIAGTKAILLCSDGLCNMLDDNAIIEIINGAGYVQERAQRLIDEANRKGGHDNISAILIDARE